MQQSGEHNDILIMVLTSSQLRPVDSEHMLKFGEVSVCNTMTKSDLQ